MKRETSYESFITKCISVAEKYKNNIDSLEIDFLNNNFKRIQKTEFVKLTKEEREENSKTARTVRLSDTIKRYKSQLQIS